MAENVTPAADPSPTLKSRRAKANSLPFSFRLRNASQNTAGATEPCELLRLLLRSRDSGARTTPARQNRARWGTPVAPQFTQIVRLVARGSTSRHLTDLRKMRNILRKMRKTATLEALFPGARQRLLAATVAQPEKWWYLSELAEFLGTRPSSLQREVAALVRTGILDGRREGTRAYIRANRRSPIFRELRSIFEKTQGIGPTLQRLLKPFERKITVSFIYGSLARAEEHTGSDIDLIIVGRVGLSELMPALREAEKRFGREVNVMNYSVVEFREKLLQGDHFLTTVMKKPKYFLMGRPNELEAITGS